MENKNDKLTVLDAKELSKIGQSKAFAIKQTFEPMAAMLGAIENDYNEIITLAKNGVDEDLSARARRLRLDIGKIKSATEKNRKEQKAEYLLAGKAIDGVSNVLKWAIDGKTESLSEIERHAAIQEKKRREALQTERVAAVGQYIENASERDLAGIDEDVWPSYLAAKKKDFDDMQAAKAAAEAKRVADEIAEAERREQLKKENARLKAEAAERERIAAAEAAEREKKEAEQERVRNAKLKAEEDERTRIAAMQAAERARQEAIRLIAAEKERKAYESKLKAEADERKRVAAALKQAQQKAAEKKADDAQKEKLLQDKKRRSEHLAVITGELLEYTTTMSEEDAVWVATALLENKIQHVKYSG